MSLKIGIVGLPNVGKSTIFNALTRSSLAKAANFPFCTIDPNVAVVEVPDVRLNLLAKIVQPDKIIPTVIEFVDIAGLIKGASQGEGLGNQFLSHIRECHALCLILRFFSDPEVIHVSDTIDPRKDYEIILSELILADLQTLEKRLNKVEKDAKSGDKKIHEQLSLLRHIILALGKGELASSLALSDEEKNTLDDLHLLTFKPCMCIANIDEHDIKNFDPQNKEKLGLKSSDTLIPICAKIEADLSNFNDSEAIAFLKEYGMEKRGLDRVVQTAYKLLNLETFFTAGPKEVRAWTIIKGTKAPEAAAEIHTDFQKGFIKAEVISFQDYINSNGEQKAKELGLLRQEGKEYVVQDGDIIHFRFNV